MNARKPGCTPTSCRYTESRIQSSQGGAELTLCGEVSKSPYASHATASGPASLRVHYFTAMPFGPPDQS